MIDAGRTFCTDSQYKQVGVFWAFPLKPQDFRVKLSPNPHVPGQQPAPLTETERQNQILRQVQEPPRDIPSTSTRFQEKVNAKELPKSEEKQESKGSPSASMEEWYLHSDPTPIGQVEEKSESDMSRFLESRPTEIEHRDPKVEIVEPEQKKVEEPKPTESEPKAAAATPAAAPAPAKETTNTSAPAQATEPAAAAEPAQPSEPADRLTEQQRHVVELMAAVNQAKAMFDAQRAESVYRTLNFVGKWCLKDGGWWEKY